MLQILGLKPFTVYKTMASEEMVEKFMTTIRAPYSVKETYWRNLVVLVWMIYYYRQVTKHTYIYNLYAEDVLQRKG